MSAEVAGSKAAAEPPRVFISYSWDSDDHKAWVASFAARLREDGVDARLDKWHVDDSPIPSFMNSEVRKADKVLLLCTPTYQEKVHAIYQEKVHAMEEGKKVNGVGYETMLVATEWFTAGIKGKTVPVLVSGEWTESVPSFAQSLPGFDLSAEDFDEEVYRRLLQRLYGLQAKAPGIGSQPVGLVDPEVKPLRGSREKTWMIPFRQNKFFTGRKDELRQLEQTLSQSGECLLHGLGGTGKTQITVEFAYMSEYKHVLWVNAETKTSLYAGYEEIARRLGMPEETDQEQIVACVKRWLDDNGDWLLVYDGADEPEELRTFLPLNPKGHIIISSRAPRVPVLASIERVEVKVMEPDAALEFLLARTQRTDATDEEREAAKNLAKAAGYLALALEQAAAFIFELPTTFTAYLKRFKEAPLVTLAKGKSYVDREREHVGRTWHINFKQVESQSAAAADLLRICAHLAAAPIPLRLFTEGASELGENLSETLKGAADDLLVLDEVLAPLLRYSLIQRSDHSISVHLLVQEVMRAESDGYLPQIIDALNALLPSGFYEDWPKWEGLDVHAEQIANLILKKELSTEVSSLFLFRMGQYSFHRGRYDEGVPLLRRSLEVNKRVLGAEHPNTLTAMGELAVLLESKGAYDEAEPLYRRALEARERLLGAEHPSTLNSLNNLALLLHSKGAYDEAEPLYRRALEGRERVLGAEHPHTKNTRANLEALLKAKGSK